MVMHSKVILTAAEPFGASGQRETARQQKPAFWRTALKSMFDGGPGTCHFAITTICNARCQFCNFAVDQLPKEAQHAVSLADARSALDILARNGIGYVFFIGGEPCTHRDLVKIVAHARARAITPAVVTNGWFLTPAKIDALAAAGLAMFSISIDAPSAAVHDDNRGLPGLTERIRRANDLCRARGLPTIASVTMSRLVGDYAALPAFLEGLGFSAVTFSYPLATLASSYLGYRDSELVTYAPDELDEVFEQVKALKKTFPVLNPTASLEEMQRHLRGEKEKFPCLGGYKFFYLDWKLDLYRCHNWAEPMCHISDFDNAPRIRDGCTACMNDCFRDDSVMQHIGVAVSDGMRAAGNGRLGEALGHWADGRNLTSLGAVLEEAPLWRKLV